MREQWNIFWNAVMFFTRIPTPRVTYSEEILNKSARFFPLVGGLVGILNFACFWVCNQIYSKEISLALSMVFSFLLTGGFHEDGLADSCDAFGGGYTKEKILEIMKDSRIGSFGVLGLFSILLLKFLTLREISNSHLLAGFVLGHSLSRLQPLWIMSFLRYVQFEGKSKPIAIQPSISTSFIAHVTVLVFILLFQEIKFFILLIPVLVFTVIYIWYLKKKISGYTGDCLGAGQQISEVLIYLTILCI